MEEILPTLSADSVDSIVCDPPYGLSFMGKKWDYDVPSVNQWKEAYRVLKPGGHLLSFGGTRTYHRMVVNIEDAGFEIRDQIMWVYGTGFPKSLSIDKAIDKKLCAEREITGRRKHPTLKDTSKLSESKSAVHTLADTWQREWDITEPSTDEAKQWEGWGTALKPANEPICVARKPLSESTVAENVLKWGAGGINIDACRIETEEKITNHSRSAESAKGKGKYGDSTEQETYQTAGQQLGRFPANLILDDYAAELLDEQAPNRGAQGPISKGQSGKSKGIYGDFGQKGDDGATFRGDSGGASKFFYIAKPSQAEKNKGLEGRNFHTTVKPILLMQYLVKLVTPKGGICLDPFCGSGTTLIACKLEMMNYIGVEYDKEYHQLAEVRIKAWKPEQYKNQTLF